MARPLTLSVVIPTYNRPQMTLRAIESVMQQTLPPDEVIVVDDASSDESANLIVGALNSQTASTKGTLLRQSKNRGVSAARNRGIRAASSEWVAFLDSDDLWHPNKWERQSRALKNAKTLRFCHSDEIWIRYGARVNPMKKHRKSGGDIFLSCLPLCSISPSSVVMERRVFEEIGYFDESLPACEDYDLWLRFCARFPVLYLDEKLLTKYGGHDDQLSRAYWGMDRFRVIALAKVLRECSDVLSDSQWREARDTLCKKLQVLELGARKRQKPEASIYYQERLAWLEACPAKKARAS